MLQPLSILALFIALDVWGLRRGIRLGKIQLDPRIDHVSHLAGYGCGIVAAQFLEPPAKPSRDKMHERSAVEPRTQRVENIEGK